MYADDTQVSIKLLCPISSDTSSLMIVTYFKTGNIAERYSVHCRIPSPRTPTPLEMNLFCLFKGSQRKGCWGIRLVLWAVYQCFSWILVSRLHDVLLIIADEYLTVNIQPRFFLVLVDQWLLPSVQPSLTLS